MNPAIDLRQHLSIVQAGEADNALQEAPVSLERLVEILEMPARQSDAYAAALPFAKGDTTAGVENELQTVVFGAQQNVDLPLVIRVSNYFKNITAKTRTGDTSPTVLHALENLLDANSEGIWENSWVRLPLGSLSPYAREIFERDLLADKRRQNGPLRCDAERFFLQEKGETRLRLPISYLLKLAVADVIGANEVHPLVRSSGKRAMSCFLNDNTSPETHSFYLAADPADLLSGACVSPVAGVSSGAGVFTGVEGSAGAVAAGETLLRFLFSHLLVQYSNRKFGLEASGQRADLYFAPHPHVRQNLLNRRISDAFYRDLFMSPCLSGWDCGEDKHRYMALCHRVLSRSQLNAVAKLKEAGIITRNLVVLPNTSNISLANNGTHLSIGSRKLSTLTTQRAAGKGGLSAVNEKYYGDLAIKIIEHFLPLFVGTYTAAPYRLDFTYFHPEKVLGFLPHELEEVHLRMIWRRWKKKAALDFMGRPLTPFGPERRQAEIGFNGFEGRYYSLFYDLRPDMARAANLQVLLSALADKYILMGRFRHADIPDTPMVESERHQIFFGTAIGIPTFFVHKRTANKLLGEVLALTEKSRSSRRYSGFIRVHNQQYCLALMKLLRRDARDLIDMLGFNADLVDLENRLRRPHTFSAAHRLTDDILAASGARHPLELSAADFNQAAEAFYRGPLKQRQLESAFNLIREALRQLDHWNTWRQGYYNQALMALLGGQSADNFIQRIREDLLGDRLPLKTICKLLQLMLLLFHQKTHAAVTASD